MKKYTAFFIPIALVVVVFLVGAYYSDKAAVPAVTAPVATLPVVPQTTNDSGTAQTQAYTNAAQGFSIQLPAGYMPDAAYTYQELGPGKDIKGTKFTIPPALAVGTNLSSDSYVSVEQVPNLKNCTAAPFLDSGSKLATVTEDGRTYSVGTSADAGAGNRYDETVYAIAGSSPCVAVRYYVHYAAIENYPAGSVTAFDQDALTTDFDQIRQSLVLTK